MEIELPPGKYVVAVSGGVDSVSLLHALKEFPDIELVVAHLDHGIRPESGEDRAFVQGLAAEYGLPFVHETSRLGPDASEATARQARYAFLEKVRQAYNAEAIVTAHHLDDVLETAVINLLRGTGRKGLSALGSRPDVARPFLGVPKNELLEYARQHGLVWREDRTNRDTAYLRNYVRHQLLTRFDEHDRGRLRKIILETDTRNREIDSLLVKYLPSASEGRLDRQLFVVLPHDVAREALAAWLRASGLRDFDSKLLERLVVAVKTGQPGNRFDIFRGSSLLIGKDDITLQPAGRWQKMSAGV